jgi:hypothetical protein
MLISSGIASDIKFPDERQLNQQPLRTVPLSTLAITRQLRRSEVFAARFLAKLKISGSYSLAALPLSCRFPGLVDQSNGEGAALSSSCHGNSDRRVVRFSRVFWNSKTKAPGFSGAVQPSSETLNVPIWLHPLVTWRCCSSRTV